MRLNRFLSLCGLGSRRGTEAIVREGRVAVNSQKVTDLATQIQDTDEVTVDGRRVSAKAGVVIVLHKPKGYLCTREDTHNRSTIYDLLPKKFHTLHHVGRLDQDSEGLILLTNRGELSQRLLHPSEGVEKEYSVRLETQFEPAHIAQLISGVMTQEGFAKAERAWLENPYVLNVVLKQGLKRQIRLMFYILGYEVERLIRTRIGGLKLHGLPKGDWRELTDTEVENNFQKRETKRTSVSKAKPRGKSKASSSADDGDDHFAPSRPSTSDAAPRRSSKKAASKDSIRKPKRFVKAKGSSPSARSYSKASPSSEGESRDYPRSSERSYSKKTGPKGEADNRRGPRSATKHSKSAPRSRAASSKQKESRSRQGVPAKKRAPGMSDGKYHR